jgi:hypothetical protein
MNTRKIKLNQNPTQIELKATEDQTTITYNSTTHPKRRCIHQIIGVWEFGSIEKNEITLINYDEVIPERHAN